MITVAFHDGTSMIMTEPILGYVRHYVVFPSTDEKEQKTYHDWEIHWTEKKI